MMLRYAGSESSKLARLPIWRSSPAQTVLVARPMVWQANVVSSELAKANAWVNKKSPTSTLASLSLRALIVSRCRRMLASSNTSSCTNVAV